MVDVVRDWWSHHEDDVVRWRRYLHQNPELSHLELGTTNYIETVLREEGLTPQRFPHTGLMVDIPASDQHAKVADGAGIIAFRGDIDALPIQENSTVSFSSTIPGVMHACGHDAHTAIMLALAVSLNHARRAGVLRRNIRIIFQPAEEVMEGGAPDVIAFGALDGVERIFAVHVEPKLPTGTVGVRVGAITSAGDVFEVHVHGSGGHSSRPHLTQDVVFALSSLATQLPALLSRHIDPQARAVVVIGSIHAGEAANAIPEDGYLRGTIRMADAAAWHGIRPILEELIAQVLAPTGVTHQVHYTYGVPPVMNEQTSTDLFVQAAHQAGDVAVVRAPQSAGGEDFAWYLEQIPGSLARLGCWDGEHEPSDLHKANLHVDEQCLEVGLKLFAGVLDALD